MVSSAPTETRLSAAVVPLEQSPVRVAFVLHVMQVAGAEVLVAETIRRLAQLIEPVVLCLDAIGTIGERLLAQGVPVICLGRKPGRDWRLALRMATSFARGVSRSFTPTSTRRSSTRPWRGR